MTDFMNTLREQRWDDHRYYHHSTINQTLHLISAISFLVAYALLLVDPPPGRAGGLAGVHAHAPVGAFLF